MPNIKIIRGQYGTYTKGNIAGVSSEIAKHLIARGIAVEITENETNNQSFEDKQVLYEKLKIELQNIKKNAGLIAFAKSNNLDFEEDDSTIAEKAEKLLVQLEASFFDRGK